MRQSLYATLSILLAVFTGTAPAATVELSWTHPTTFEDGAALPIGQIEQTRVEAGTCSSPGVFGTKQAEIKVLAPATTVQMVVAPGTWCYRAFTKVVAAVGGQESMPSIAVSNIVPYPKPSPPTLSTTTKVVYELLPDTIDGARLGKEVGSAPLGTQCTGEGIPTQKGIVYELPLDKVHLGRMPRSAIVVGFCA